MATKEEMIPIGIVAKYVESIMKSIPGMGSYKLDAGLITDAGALARLVSIVQNVLAGRSGEAPTSKEAKPSGKDSNPTAKDAKVKSASLTPDRRRKIAKFVKAPTIRFLSTNAAADSLNQVGLAEVVEWINLLTTSSTDLDEFVIDPQPATVSDLRAKVSLIADVLKRRAQAEEDMMTYGRGYSPPPSVIEQHQLSLTAEGRFTRTPAKVPFNDADALERKRRINSFLGK